MSEVARETPEAEGPVDPGKPFFPCDPFGPEFYDQASCRFVNTVELPVSAERLFAIFEDPTSWPRWAPGIGEVEWTSPRPYAAGTTRTVRFWGGMSVYEVFPELAPPTAMSFRFYGTSERVWRAFGERYRVTPLGDRCRLEWTVAYEPAGFIGWLPVRMGMALNFKVYMALLRRYCRRHPG